MLSTTSVLLGLMAMPAIHAVILPSHNNIASNSNTGFISFPIKRGERSSRTLTGRQATASLINEQDTSYTIDRECFFYYSAPLSACWLIPVS